MKLNLAYCEEVSNTVNKAATAEQHFAERDNIATSLEMDRVRWIYCTCLIKDVPHFEPLTIHSAFNFFITFAHTKLLVWRLRRKSVASRWKET